MDSPITDTLKNVAGYGVGTLAALTTIKSGGLGSYLMNRQRLLQDPAFRASLEGSPFAAGVFGVSGERGPAPGHAAAGRSWRGRRATRGVCRATPARRASRAARANRGIAGADGAKRAGLRARDAPHVAPAPVALRAENRA